MLGLADKQTRFHQLALGHFHFFTFSVERSSTWYQPNFGGGCQIFWGIPAKVLVLKLLALYRYLRVLPRYLYQYQLINAGSDNLQRWMYPRPIKHSNWKYRRRAGVSGKFSYEGIFHCHVWYGMDIYLYTYILFKWSKLIPNDPRILAVLATLGTLQVFLSFLELSHEVADHLQMLGSQIMEYLISEGAPNGRWRPIYRLMWVWAKRCQKYSKVIKPAARSLQKLVLFKSNAILILPSGNLT